MPDDDLLTFAVDKPGHLPCHAFNPAGIEKAEAPGHNDRTRPCIRIMDNYTGTDIGG
jgi:hypothetical protein